MMIFYFVCFQLDGSYDRCNRYAVDWQEILSYNESITAPNASWPVEMCKDGWEYNTSEIFSSIVKDVSTECVLQIESLANYFNFSLTWCVIEIFIQPLG